MKLPRLKAGGRLGWRPSSPIRVRLAAALAIALLPVLVIGAVQAGIALRMEAQTRQEVLILSAQRAAATARARIDAAQVLLQTLGPRAIGLECAQRLNDVKQRVPGYVNLIRFDRYGRVSCASATVPADPQRGQRPWFERLRDGDDATATGAPGVAYAPQPVMLAALRATDETGAFDGAFVAVIELSSLQVGAPDLLAPAGSHVALLDEAGKYLGAVDPTLFAPPPPSALETPGRTAPRVGACGPAGQATG